MEQNQQIPKKMSLGKSWDFADKFFRFISWNFLTGTMFYAAMHTENRTAVIFEAVLAVVMGFIIVAASIDVMEYAHILSPKMRNKYINFTISLVLVVVVQYGATLVIATAISAAIIKK